ncbi:flagellar basal-body rod modification protein FlgD [Rhodoferax sp. OV413]|uniref:flagellar hook assembly protein FlgD n=1 Tax=Rhodoferax sp. OV413 TaxID=1855285 RepID=UPI00088BE9F7|nr:flagellar hook capping FlgD N-terminal domain-containing protein [Rhodoferax sp. OV413]SDP93487.1 flagellar basal-body rod modification protein FlgD [Rhodoferax sp. OV413]
MDFNTINATSSSLTSAASNKNATTSEASQDRFLKLLVAQLNNQDPMNPMDNAQMTSQLAQINTVSGIQTLNDTMTSMASQIAALQSLQGSTTIGHEVLTEGSTVSVTDGVGKGAFDLSGNADTVKVEVRNAAGTVLGTVNMGALESGRQSFTWDASQYANAGELSFKVVATNGSTVVTSTALERNKVVSVSNDNNVLNLQLQNGESVAYSAVKAIL